MVGVMTVEFSGIKRPEIVVDLEHARRRNCCFPSDAFKDCLTAKMLKPGVNCLVCKSLEKLPNDRVFIVELLECLGLLWLGHVKADFDL